jgi:hypothetical protein
MEALGGFLTPTQIPWWRQQAPGGVLGVGRKGVSDA